MSENNNNSSKNTYIIRAILCVVAIIIVVLSWVEIIPDTVGIVAASLILSVVSIWNGIDSLKENKKGSAIFKFVMSAILIVLCLVVIIF